jgi:hypothetical protein
MPYVYIPLPEGDKRGKAYCRQYMPDGRDLGAICLEHPGWLPDQPANVDVYDDTGTLIQRGPTKAAKDKEE